MPVYSFAADLPVLGSIVRVLHVGSGGEVTDGAQAGADTDGGTVELTFTGANGALDLRAALHGRAPARAEQDSAHAARRQGSRLRVYP